MILRNVFLYPAVFQDYVMFGAISPKPPITSLGLKQGLGPLNEEAGSGKVKHSMVAEKMVIYHL